MSKNVFWIAFIVAVVGGLAGTSGLSADFEYIATFLLVAGGVYLGWTCVPESRAKDYAIGAAALVFLNAPAWGDAGMALGAIPWGIGGYVAAIFGSLVNFVITIAAVGMLKSLVDGAKGHAGAGI